MPEAALPFMVELPPGDREWGDDPLEEALVRPDTAQLLERNRERRQIRLHPLIRDFARGRREGAFAGSLVATAAKHLGSTEHLMATPALSLRELPSALEPLAVMDGAAKDDAGAVGSLCRMLRLGAHALICTADPRTGRPDPGTVNLSAEDRERWDAAGVTRQLRHQ